jgi:hypothetical protein
VEQVKAQIKTLVKNNNILLKPHFAAFDTTNRSHITVTQFSRALKQLDLLPDEATFDLLAREYADLNTCHDINYVRFCDELDTKIDTKVGEVPKDTPEYFTKPMVTKMDKGEFRAMDTMKPRFLEATVNVS